MNTPLHIRLAARSQRGTTMIEILVAIVVLSFGMLGMAGLQAAALQSNKEARLQSSAVRLARELGELMRGNKEVAIATTAATNPYLVTFTGASLPTATANCFSAACASGLDVASFQMGDWAARANAELPGLRVAVCIDDAPYNSGGLPQWACSGTGGTTVVKIGWTQLSTDRGAVGSSSAASATSGLIMASSADSRPGVVLTLLPGSSE